MTFIFWLSFALAIGLAIYLVIALLKPEYFA